MDAWTTTATAAAAALTIPLVAAIVSGISYSLLRLLSYFHVAMALITQHHYAPFELIQSYWQEKHVAPRIAMQPSWAVRYMQKRWPNVLFFQPTKERVVALTIDDGPHEDITPELLDILKENDCRATWFLIGSNLEKCPALLGQIHNEGHEVANHTMHDVASWQLPLEEFEKQLIEVDRKLDALYFLDDNRRKVKWFRPGHGFFTKKMLQVTEAHGYRTALGSLFPLDTLFKNQGENIAKYLLWRVYNGAIIILHDRGPQRKQTAKVLRLLLPTLKQRGYSVVTLSELLKLTK